MIDENKIVEVIQNAMSLFVEGSESGASGVWWNIRDTLDDNREVAWLRDREERNLQLRRKNARSAWNVAKAALAEEVHESLRALEVATRTAEEETLTAPNASGWPAVRVVLRRIVEFRTMLLAARILTEL